MSEEGAIVTQRNIDGNCLFLETMHLTQSVKIIRIWKLLDKPQRTFSMMSSEDAIDGDIPKKKKRRGQTQLFNLFYRK